MSDQPSSAALPSTKPYLVRAFWEWCNDHGFTPYLMVAVDASCQVPKAFVKDGQIVLNIGQEATQNLKMTNEAIHFHARFGGVARELFVPIERVAAIYARENGAAMSFEVEAVLSPEAAQKLPEPPLPPDAPPPVNGGSAGNGGGRSHLRRIK
ncbi:MAG: ClpXP protease specificity-enhancing factor [Zoogloeaceae bacterium]|jgi:stringent starvation protein B|nr:ClpXP protease specificity-enhancing factor [Zoogloeaceae bacterium]